MVDHSMATTAVVPSSTGTAVPLGDHNWGHRNIALRHALEEEASHMTTHRRYIGYTLPVSFLEFQHSLHLHIYIYGTI